MFRVAIVEDEPQLQEIAKKYLEKEGYFVFAFDDGESLLETLEEESMDLVLLDVMLPGMDGWQILSTIRKTLSIPVLMLTARREEEDKLLGFELGADDYLTKPFSNKEMIARVKALLKRTYGAESAHQLSFGELTIDERKHIVLIRERVIELTQTEFTLLLYLMKNHDVALTREQILIKVWGYDFDGDDRTVDTQIKRLRKKLMDLESYIQTVRGVGYKFEVPRA